MSTNVSDLGVSGRQHVGRSLVLGAPAIVAIVPSVVLLIQLALMNEYVLLVSESIRLLVLIGGAFYLATSHSDFFWSAPKPRPLWYAVTGIVALTTTNILASAAITIALQHHYGRLPFLLGLGR